MTKQSPYVFRKVPGYTASVPCYEVELRATGEAIGKVDAEPHTVEYRSGGRTYVNSRHTSAAMKDWWPRSAAMDRCNMRGSAWVFSTRERAAKCLHDAYLLDDQRSRAADAAAKRGDADPA